VTPAGEAAGRIASILRSSPGHRDALQALALAGPRHGWLGAGFVRNAVWDVLSGRPPDLAALADLDVVHFDARAGDAAASAAADARFEAALRAARPALRWSVTDQARMAARNGHAPYRDLAAALAHWPETATAIAVRLRQGEIEVMAPLGVADLLGLILRPGPAHLADPRVTRARLRAKRWQAHWPGLRVIGLEGD
jgi:hypothetical protein